MRILISSWRSKPSTSKYIMSEGMLQSCWYVWFNLFIPLQYFTFIKAAVINISCLLGRNRTSCKYNIMDYHLIKYKAKRCLFTSSSHGETCIHLLFNIQSLSGSYLVPTTTLPEENIWCFSCSMPHYVHKLVASKASWLVSCKATRFGAQAELIVLAVKLKSLASLSSFVCMHVF